MKVTALINPKSGSVPKDASAALTEAVTSYGLDVAVHCSAEHDISEMVSRAIDDGPDILIAWGGDGTLACAMEAAGAADIPVLPMPGGTMNLLCQRVHGEGMTWQSCLDALKAPKETSLPAGQCGEHRFYIAAMLGNLAGLATPREQARDGNLIGGAATLINEDILDFDARLRVLAPGHSISRAAALAVVVPDCGAKGLVTASINPDSLIGATALGLSAMIRGWQEVDDIDQIRTSRVRIEDTGGKAISATFDGELRETEPRLNFCRIENAVTVVSAAT